MIFTKKRDTKKSSKKIQKNLIKYKIYKKQLTETKYFTIQV